MGFSIFYRLLKANGKWFMNIWSYGVPMVFLWCILELLCIAYLHYGECTYIKKFQIHRIFMGCLWVFDILSDFGSWWYTIHEYMVLWGVYGIFMVYFTTFVYSLSAPWCVYLDKKFLDSWVFIWFFTAFVYSFCFVQRSTNAHAQ